MGIWKSPPVELEPVVFLSRWQVMETDKGFRHFIGHNMETMSGRASTPIVKFDPETRRGVTQSGRIYELIAESGADFNAKAAAANPLKRIATPEDCARAIVACATHLTYATGVKIVVDGGRSL